MCYSVTIVSGELFIDHTVYLMCYSVTIESVVTIDHTVYLMCYGATIVSGEPLITQCI